MSVNWSLTWRMLRSWDSQIKLEIDRGAEKSRIDSESDPMKRNETSFWCLTSDLETPIDVKKQLFNQTEFFLLVHQDWVTASHSSVCHRTFDWCLLEWTTSSWTHITESTEFWIWLQCICWQHVAPNTYIEFLTSNLHAMIRTHNFDFNIRFWPISALMSKT